LQLVATVTHQTCLTADPGAHYEPHRLRIERSQLKSARQTPAHIYGHETLADVEADCRRVAKEYGFELRFHQSNREYEIIDWIHEAREAACGIVINPAAFTHTSVAILDALNAFEAPIIEVHISNVHKREEFRHHSYISLRADGVIAGLGTQGYTVALGRLAHLLDKANAR
jgi:3-dehydroquinate dehydratase-2